MKLAITIWGNRVSPVFDAASTLLIAHIENQTVVKKTYTAFDPGMLTDLLRMLEETQVDILICGAISTKPADRIVDSGIKLVSFVTGDAMDFIDTFAQRQTIKKNQMMPGCSKQYCWHHKSQTLHL